MARTMAVLFAADEISSAAITVIASSTAYLRVSPGAADQRVEASASAGKGRRKARRPKLGRASRRRTKRYSGVSAAITAAALVPKVEMDSMETMTPKAKTASTSTSAPSRRSVGAPTPSRSAGRTRAILALASWAWAAARRRRQGTGSAGGISSPRMRRSAGGLCGVSVTAVMRGGSRRRRGRQGLAWKDGGRRDT